LLNGAPLLNKAPLLNGAQLFKGAKFLNKAQLLNRAQLSTGPNSSRRSNSTYFIYISIKLNSTFPLLTVSIYHDQTIIIFILEGGHHLSIQILRLVYEAY
jgi:hypothetical protein